MAWSPPKSVAVTSLGAGYALCSGCPGYMIALDQVDTHTAWHQTYGDDLKTYYGVSDLVALPTGQGEVTVTWTNPTPIPALTTVTRSGVSDNGSPMTFSVVLPGNVQQQVFGSLPDNTVMTFTVTPNGGQASSAQCTTMPTPGTSTTPPTDSTATTDPTTNTDTGSIGGAQARNAS